MTGQPHICVSFEPAPSSDETVDRSNRAVYPRQRGGLEIFNGSIDYALVKSWLERCCTEHGAECHRSDEESILPLDIYLIDVHKRQFVRHSAGNRFVALSYVWGRVDIDGGIRTAPKPGQVLPTLIPQTMVDAIAFVDRLGEHYLWIDQLCIDQANEEEKQRQIGLMDRIFASAYLTLVNLDGPDADWGLPGISRPLLQSQQPTVTLDSGRLMATFVYSNWDNNGSSIWDSRGWTLQERLLSQRCLMFAKTYISMTCRTEFFHDCLSMNQGAKGTSTWLGHDYFREDGSGIIIDGAEWDFKNYDAVVSVFSSRQLTHQADALNACQGLLNKLSQADGSKFSFGLAMHDWQRALIWVPHYQHIPARRLGFPSWSWTGWLGRIEYAYWVGDMPDYLYEDSGENTPPSKRRRMQPFDLELLDRDSARIKSYPSKGGHPPILQVDTTVTRFKLKLVRRDGEPHRALKANSLQSKTAVGDHWTLISEEGKSLRDEAGEHQCFELTDHFFRLKAEYSQLLHEQNNKADFMFVAHWSRIRDSAASDKWLYNMVSALVVIRNQDGTAWRLASVLVKAEDWYPKAPQPELICLV